MRFDVRRLWAAANVSLSPRPNDEMTVHTHPDK
jgi:hypothetical protein